MLWNNTKWSKVPLPPPNKANSQLILVTSEYILVLLKGMLGIPCMECMPISNVIKVTEMLQISNKDYLHLELCNRCFLE